MCLRWYFYPYQIKLLNLLHIRGAYDNVRPCCSNCSSTIILILVMIHSILWTNLGKHKAAVFSCVLTSQPRYLTTRYLICHKNSTVQLRWNGVKTPRPPLCIFIFVPLSTLYTMIDIHQSVCIFMNKQFETNTTVYQHCDHVQAVRC